MKKGFTLIELLAVIVILAIIAVIATPIVIGIINDAKRNANNESINLYIDAAKKAIVQKQIKNSSFKPNKCEIQNDGSINCMNDTEQYENIKVEMNGNTPTSGLIIIKGNKIKFRDIVLNGEKHYYLSKMLEDNNNNKEPNIGDKYEYAVTDGVYYNFYVLSLSGNYVTLIMDRNICEDGSVNYTSANNYCKYAWYDDGDETIDNDKNEYGPVTAMQALYNATKNWDNVQDMDLSGDNRYYDEGHTKNSANGYGSLETTPYGIKIIMRDGQTEVTRDNNQTPVILYEKNKVLKARLPKLSEIYNDTKTDKNHCHSNAGSCPAWLTNSLNSYSTYYPDNEHIEQIYGYYTLSACNTNTRKNCAFIVYYTGTGENISYTSVKIGIRPVVKVLKSDLTN